MKNFLAVIALIFAAAVSQAQTHNGLKGPEAKNYKPWMHKTKASAPVAVASSASQRLQGPAAKNYKPWRDDQDNKRIKVQTAGKERRLQGPAAKNYKPWMKRKQKAAQAKKNG